MLLSAGMALTASAAVAGPIQQVRANGGPVSELGNVIRRDGTQAPVKTPSTTTLTQRTNVLKVPKIASPAAARSAFDVYIIGDNVDGDCWTLASPNGLMTMVSDGVYEWDGEVLGSGFKFNDGTWDGGYFPGTEIIANIGSNGDTLDLGEPYYFNASTSSSNISLNPSYNEIEKPHVVIDLNEGTIVVTGLSIVRPDSNPDLYVFGANVNESYWEYAAPQAKMTEVSTGVYEWDGDVLGYSFRINDGSSNYGFIPGTEIIANIGSNGSPLNPGEPYYFSNGENVLSIGFAGDCVEVQNPHVRLDLNEGTIVVTGTPLSSSEVVPVLYLRGSFNDWGTPDDYRMTRDDETGIYTLKSITIPQGDYEFKIGSKDWRYQYGPSVWDVNLVPGDSFPVVYNITVNEELYNIQAYLGGTYDVTLDPNNLTLLFTKTGSVTPTINYSEFRLYCGGQYKEEYPIEATDVENRYIAHSVPMTDYCYFYLFSYNGYQYYQYYALGSEEPPVTPDDTATLHYFDYYSGMDYLWYLGCDGFDGLYDVTIDFNGEDAELTFKRTGDLIFDPRQVIFVNYNPTDETYWSLGFPAMTDGHTAIYKNICLSGEEYFFFSDIPSGKSFGQSSEDIQTLSPDNMSIDVLLDGPTSIIPVTGFEGVYDLTLVYNEDFSRATATLSSQVLPDVITAYEGDLYIVGAGNDWLCGDPAYKMTCLEPGLYEWSGDSLYTDFKFNGGDWDGMFPGTDIYIDLGGYRYPSNTDLDPGEPYNLTFQGYDIRFADGIEALENVKVTLDLREMTLLVTGEQEVPKLDLDNMVMYIPDHGTYSGTTTENGVAYTNIPFYPGYSYVLFACEGTNFGWPENLDGLHVVTDESPSTLIVRNPEAFVSCTLDGLYNVLVEFNDTQTEGTMTVIRVGDHPAFDLSEMYLLNSNDEYYEPTVEGEGIVYHNVRVEPQMGFALGSVQDVFGWTELDVENVPWITEENPETVLYSESMANDGQLYYAFAYMEGIFDVYVTFNADFTEATMRFEKIGEIYAYLNVTIENGTKFTVRSQFGASEYIRVSTNDPFWGFSGLSENGEEVTYDNLMPELYGYVNIPEDSNLDLVFFTEYLGECKVLEGTVGAEVTFDNDVIITRVAEGVEIRNLEQGEEIAVYTLGGQMVTLVKAQNDSMTINLEKGQAFIVRAGSVAAKVVM